MQDFLAIVLGVFCLLMLAISPWQIDRDMSIPFYKGPMLMPVIALAMGALASIPAFIRLIFNPIRSFSLPPLPLKPIAMFIIAACHPVLMLLIGLEAATFLVLGAELYVTGIRRLLSLAAIPAAASLLFWIVFRQLLDVWVPEPFLYSIFMHGA